MTGYAISSGDLVITRALVSGPGTRNVDLSRSLSRLHIDDITSGDEILLVPKLRCRVRLSPVMPASHFAEGLTEELRHIRREALVDPSSGMPSARAFRFTNRDRYAAWLLQSWLRPVSAQTRDILSALLRGQSIEQWQRRIILIDGLCIVRLVRALAVQGNAIMWAARLSPADCISVFQALGRAYGFQCASAEVAEQSSESFWGSSAPPRVAVADLSKQPLARSETIVSAIMEVKVQRLVESLLIEHGNRFFELAADQRAVLLASQILASAPNLGPSINGSIRQTLASQPRTKSTPLQLPAAVLRKVSHDEVRTIRSPQTKLKTAEKQQNLLIAYQPENFIAASPDEMARRTSGPAIKSANISPRSTGLVYSPVGTVTEHTVSQRVDTQFGGLLFVTNIFLALKLYPDFTMPLGKRLEPSPFWLLAWTGVHIFGRPFQRDPLFRLLLDAGIAGQLPANWQVAPDWLDDLPRSGAAFRKLDAAPKPWSRQAIRASAVGSRAKSRLLGNRNERWLSKLAAFIRFRVAHAAHGLSVSKLRIPASVELTDDSLEAHYVLTELPLAVRMAGLDRNPGWLPSEGRSISFHFS